MRAALLALTACQLSPVQPLRYIQSPNTDSEALSNIELLIPLLVGEPAPRRARAQDSRELDERYSSIPAYAFTLDEQPAGRRHPPRMRSARPPQPEWREALRYLRAELLPPARCSCRRDLMPMGDNSAMVERYVHVVRKKPPPPWLTDTSH